MSEELIVAQCSPTMAGLKTGNLFRCSYRSEKELLNIPFDAEIIIKKGLPIKLTVYGKTGFYKNLKVNLHFTY